MLALRHLATKIAHQQRNFVVGTKAEVTAAIADGRHPVGTTDDEETVYDFFMELYKNKRVTDYTYECAEKRFGKKGIVDLTGINAYYTFWPCR